MPSLACIYYCCLDKRVLRLLHIGETNVPIQDQPYFGPWNKIRSVLDALNAKFKIHYIPPRHVSIDESLVGMKNRIAYLQYMPNKHHSRFGIKKFELCDATSSYVLHIELYAEKGFPVFSEHGEE